MNPNTRILKYSFGNAYGPNGILGRFQLEITVAAAAPTVSLECQQLDSVRIWTATLKPETEQALWEALVQSDFPDTPRPTAVVPDTTMCELGVQHAELFPEEVGVSLPLNTLQAQPGYKDLLGILHSIIAQIGAGTFQGLEDQLGEVVVGYVRLGYTETVTDI